jgi:aminodeoxyfutalosine deaminase
VVASETSDVVPKIELHVHLEQAVDPATLFAFGHRNGVGLPASDIAGLRELMRFRNLDEFIFMVRTTMKVFRTEQDFRQAVIEYARRASEQHVVYLELSFTPGVHARRGVAWEAMFAGVCDGAQEARETLGVDVRITPDIPRDHHLEDALELVHHAARHRDRGVVGIGLAGPEVDHPPEPFADAFARAREHGLGSVPHAGEAVGPESVRGALQTLDPTRLRHGVRAVEDPALLREIADRGIVCDVCLHSNVQLGVVPSLAEHPLKTMVDAGIACTVNTDDPTFFDCDVTSEHAAARALGVGSRELFEAGVRGALCDTDMRQRLEGILRDQDWTASEV